MIPTIDRLAPNFTRFAVGDFVVWFSYETPIAFRDPALGTLHVRRNDWGPTTSKHLNKICSDKDRRLPANQFQDLLQKAVNNINSDQRAT